MCDSETEEEEQAKDGDKGNHFTLHEQSLTYYLFVLREFVALGAAFLTLTLAFVALDPDDLAAGFFGDESRAAF
jgi:hypothetical protein